MVVGANDRTRCPIGHGLCHYFRSRLAVRKVRGQKRNNTAHMVAGRYSEIRESGQNPRLLMSGDQDPQFYQELWQTIRAGKTWRGELINRRKDGSLYTEEMNIR